MTRRLLLAALLLSAACSKAPAFRQRPAPGFDLPDSPGAGSPSRPSRGRWWCSTSGPPGAGPASRRCPGYVEFWRKNQPRGVEVVGSSSTRASPRRSRTSSTSTACPTVSSWAPRETQAAFDATEGLPTTFVDRRRGHDPHQDPGQHPRPSSRSSRRPSTRRSRAAEPDHERRSKVSVTRRAGERGAPRRAGPRPPQGHRDPRLREGRAGSRGARSTSRWSSPPPPAR